MINLVSVYGKLVADAIGKWNRIPVLLKKKIKESKKKVEYAIESLKRRLLSYSK